MNRCSSTHDLVLAVVARIPKGRVATYGQIARLAGLPGHARLVGYALHALSENSRLPWHRVINAEGRISLRSDGSGHDRLQRVLLERESVRFNAQGAIPLTQYQWRPKAPTVLSGSRSSRAEFGPAPPAADSSSPRPRSRPRHGSKRTGGA